MIIITLSTQSRVGYKRACVYRAGSSNLDAILPKWSVASITNHTLTTVASFADTVL